MSDHKQPSLFDQATEKFDAENAADPNTETVEGVSYPRELLYARRLSAWVDRLKPDAAEELRLASRCQHLCRWMMPRDSFPMNRTGYLKWRETLKSFHAEKVGEILQEVGYSKVTISRVKNLVLKKNFPDDLDSRVLEDALCLLFLETQLEYTSEKTGEEKIIHILQRTWKKMTPQARKIALKLPMNPHCQLLVKRAVLNEREG